MRVTCQIRKALCLFVSDILIQGREIFLEFCIDFAVDLSMFANLIRSYNHGIRGGIVPSREEDDQLIIKLVRSRNNVSLGRGRIHEHIDDR